MKKLKDQDPLFIGAIIVGLLGVGFLLYAFVFSSKDFKKDLPGEFQNISQGTKFHPDSVVSFEWELSDVYFSFSRKDRMSQWEPSVNPKEIQKRLNLLSSLEYKTKKVPDGSLLKFTLKLDNRKLMRGFWNGYELAWTTGPLKGMSAKLTGSQTRLFLSGVHTFEPKKMNWCQERFSKIDGSYKPVNAKEPRPFSATEEGGHWDISSSKNKIDATFMEKWMGRNCMILVEQFIDSKYFDFFNYPPASSKIDFHFKKQGMTQIEWNNDGLFRITDSKKESKLFYSKTLLKNIMQLF